MANYTDAMLRSFCAEFCAAAVLCAASAPAQEPPSDPWPAAQAAAAQGDWNGALNRLDEARATHSSDYAFWMLYGEATLAFTQQRLAQGERDPGLIEGLYGDAAAAYRRAGELDTAAAAPWLGLARTLRLSGDPPGAYAAAAAAAERSGTPPAIEALLELGLSSLSLTAATVQAGQPAPAAARAGEEALRTLLAAGDARAVAPLADLLGWRQLTSEAREVLVTALGSAPAQAEWIQRLQNLNAAAPALLVADLERVRAAAPGDPTLLWYLGDAYFRAQQAARARADYLAAYEALDRAEECFLQAMADRADFAATCLTFLHLVRTARGWTLYEEGRANDAAQTFAAALEADPARLEPSLAPDGLRLGLYRVVDDFFQNGRLAEVRGVLQRVTAVHDANPDWWNNYAFACRELGVAAAGRGDAAEAAPLFEESWTAYGRCVELSPDDVRLVNDRALIAVYYLDHDLELAERELQRAVAMGAEQLAALAPDAPPGQRQQLEEATGDAWENLAYLEVMRRGRRGQAEEYLARSLRHYPYEAREGVRRIRVSLEKLPSESPAPEAGNGGC